MTSPHDAAPALPPVWMVGFFVAMLLAIAILPLSPFRHWWEKNRSKLIVALVLSAFPAVYYLRHDPHELIGTMVHEYVPFIILLGSLFVIAGGIRITGDLRATPGVSMAFLGVGAVFASFIGTTGASMLLIRPVLQTNQERTFRKHTVIFFIFLVSNIGGSLLPVGDPPLFLGYLEGVPFFWTLNLWKVWIAAVAPLLLVYFLVDRRYYRREPAAQKALDRARIEPLRIQGATNLAWLFAIMAVVVFLHERAPVAFLRTPHLREAAMLAVVALSLLTSPRQIWRDNKFTLGPITEVAFLFLGIFLTMIPALVLLKARGGELGVSTPAEYFWATGALSSFLDNAPTYLVYFKTAAGMFGGAAGETMRLVGHGVDKVPHDILLAISAGAVFMGANTYIGNGPNFMVKSIAEESGVPMPSFFGYMAWSCLILVPLFGILTVVFFR